MQFQDKSDFKVRSPQFISPITYKDPTLFIRNDYIGIAISDKDAILEIVQLTDHIRPAQMIHLIFERVLPV